MQSEASNPAFFIPAKSISPWRIAEQQEMAIVSICRNSYGPAGRDLSRKIPDQRRIWQFAAIRISILNALISRKDADEGKKGRPVHAGARQRVRGCVNHGWNWIYPRLSNE